MYVHFIGIGDSEMQDFALALLTNGYQVSGSDDEIDGLSRLRLEQYGLLIENAGWYPEILNGSIDAVVLGRHAQAENPELLKAQELGLKIYSYPEFLYELSKYKTRVVIAGNSGKTTISSMILHVMDYHDKDVDYAVALPLAGHERRVKLTDANDFMLIEGDDVCNPESDTPSKLHLYQPNIGLLSGIAQDHNHDSFSHAAYREQFKRFVDGIVVGGSITYNEEDEEVKKIVEASENTIRKLPYHTPTYTTENGQTLLETPEGMLPLEVFGKHNLNNLAGAKWICQHMGVDEDDFYEAIASFSTSSLQF